MTMHSANYFCPICNSSGQEHLRFQPGDTIECFFCSHIGHSDEFLIEHELPVEETAYHEYDEPPEAAIAEMLYHESADEPPGDELEAMVWEHQECVD